MSKEELYDKKKTSAAVAIFLQNDFWHYMNLGGIHPSQLSSPQLTLAPGGHNNTNTTEKSLIGTMSKAERAQWIAETILLAINDCTDLNNRKHKSLIRDFYLEDLTNEEVKIRLNFSEYQIRREKPKALIEFAERLEYWKGRRKCTDQEIPRLLVLKST
ncbi:ArpU family phage packaging/lysis transcriptional regulator [Lactobacillus crispatus]|uniref:ArpU family phage packaging/lysis transcriptional regulator n=1 Tax=Lactobacillus crispatus TaxID=47770 RepID=UPI0010404B0F|nr:ArpU family phage packaging/lysis transcriptional regulator [Lactobacillus crispatus]